MEKGPAKHLICIRQDMKGIHPSWRRHELERIVKMLPSFKLMKAWYTWSPFTAPSGLVSGHSPLQLFSDPPFGGQLLERNEFLVKWMHSEWHLFVSNSMLYCCTVDGRNPATVDRQEFFHQQYHIFKEDEIGSILPPQKHMLHKLSRTIKLPWPLP